MRPLLWSAAGVLAGVLDRSSRVSDYYSFNVFERRNGRWMYVSAFLP